MLEPAARNLFLERCVMRNRDPYNAYAKLHHLSVRGLRPSHRIVTPVAGTNTDRESKNQSKYLLCNGFQPCHKANTRRCFAAIGSAFMRDCRTASILPDFPRAFSCGASPNGNGARESRPRLSRSNVQPAVNKGDALGSIIQDFATAKHHQTSFRSQSILGDYR
jgi:hypothetical protein